MTSTFFLKFAFVNLKKNRRYYLPCLIGSSFFISIFQILLSFSRNGALIHQSNVIGYEKVIIGGSIVSLIFSIMFILNTGGQLTIIRRKELTLYRMLGMDHSHIARLLVYENLLLMTTAILGGIAGYLFFGKLIFLTLLKLTRMPLLPFHYIDGEIVRTTILCYLAIYSVMTIRQAIGLRSKKNHHGTDKVHEPSKEKTRLFSLLFGILALGTGITLAISSHSIVSAYLRAVPVFLLLIVSTYLLILSGSRSILLSIKSRKKHYYKGNHFTVISGLLARIGEYRLSLANITIFSTVVWMVLSSSLSLYMGLEDVLSAKFNRELMIRINAKGPEESETIVRQLRETASEMDLPIENLIEYEFRSLFAIQEKNSIRFGIRSIWEIGGLKQVYLIPLESYNRNSAQPIELKENEVFLLSSGIEFPWESIRLGSNELKIKGRGGDLSLVTERLRQSAITFFLVIHDQEQLNRVLSESEGLVQNIGNNTLIGCDISGTAEDRNRYSAAIIEKLKDFKSGTFESKQMARRYFLNVYGLYLLIAFLLGIQFLLATGIIFYLKLVSEGSFHQHRREMMVRAGLSRDEVMTSVKTQNAILFFIPFIGSILLFLLPTKMIRMLLEAFFLYNFKTYLFSAMVVVAVVLSITFRMYHAVILMSRKLPG